MHAGIVYAPNDIRYELVDTPEPREGEVQIRVKYTGICGSDVPRVNGNACHFYPNILGHEFSGTVSKLGVGVTDRKIGDRVAGIPLVPCMKCPDCRKGNYSLCRFYSFIGSRRFGSFAEYVVVPADNTFLLPKEVAMEQGALFEPFTVAAHALALVKFQGGRDVAVFGCGTIGLLLIEWCRLMGARSITAINRSKEKLERARRLGANVAVSTEDANYQSELIKITQNKGFDYLFDATGNAKMMQEEFRYAANKAYLCMVGTPKEKMEFTVDQWENLNRREMHLTGSWMSYSAPFPGKEWELTAYYMKEKQLTTDGIVDRIIGLSDIAEAFKLYKCPNEIKGKILIDSEK